MILIIVMIFATVEMGSGFGGMGSMASFGGGAMGNPSVAQTYQTMMQHIQKLIAYNPEFLTKGIPNNLLQMCMEQTQKPTSYGVSTLNIPSKIDGIS